MISKCDTSSRWVKGAIIGLSALGLTTTFNTNNMIFNEPISLVNLSNINENEETTTKTAKKINLSFKSGYDTAREIFGENMRDFTAEEAIAYKMSLDKIYKPLGVNISDLC